MATIGPEKSRGGEKKEVIDKWLAERRSEEKKEIKFELTSVEELDEDVAEFRRDQQSELLSKAEDDSASPSLQYYRGVCYELGLRGVSKDLKKAEELYKKAAKQGHPKAAYRIGILHSIVRSETKVEVALEKTSFLQDRQKALEYFEKAASGGHRGAQYNFAVCLAHGSREEQHLAREKFSDLSNSQDKEHLAAAYNLTVCYQNGIGRMKNTEKKITRDEKRAAKLFERLAEAGNLRAAYNIAICYKHGKGVDKNEEKMAGFLEQAANGGILEAQYELAIYGAQKAASAEAKEPQEAGFKKAAGFLIAAAEGGHVHAAYDIGRCYEFGIGVEVNLEQAKKYYEKARDAGYQKAEPAIARIAETELAKTAYAEAYAEFNRLLFPEKREIKKIEEPIVQLAFKAHNLKHILVLHHQHAQKPQDLKATYELAKCYRYGIGVEKDAEMAKFFYRDAKCKGWTLPPDAEAFIKKQYGWVSFPDNRDLPKLYHTYKALLGRLRTIGFNLVRYDFDSVLDAVDIESHIRNPCELHLGQAIELYAHADLLLDEKAPSMGGDPNPEHLLVHAAALGYPAALAKLISLYREPGPYQDADKEEVCIKLYNELVNQAKTLPPETREEQSAAIKITISAEQKQKDVGITVEVKPSKPRVNMLYATAVPLPEKPEKTSGVDVGLMVLGAIGALAVGGSYYFSGPLVPNLLRSVGAILAGISSPAYNRQLVKNPIWKSPLAKGITFGLGVGFIAFTLGIVNLLKIDLASALWQPIVATGMTTATALVGLCVWPIVKSAQATWRSLTKSELRGKLEVGKVPLNLDPAILARFSGHHVEVSAPTPVAPLAPSQILGSAPSPQ